MNNYYETLNQLLVKLFNNILQIEEHSLKNEQFPDLSITESHVLEAIGPQSARNMSSVARDLGITIGTLTIAINNLLRKGYVDRKRSENDRRKVFISLTEKGRNAFAHHAHFHDEMINSVTSRLTEQEIKVLVTALDSINNYFGDKYKLMKPAKDKG